MLEPFSRGLKQARGEYVKVFIVKSDQVHIIYNGVKHWIEHRLGDDTLEKQGLEVLELLDRHIKKDYTQLEVTSALKKLQGPRPRLGN